MAAELGSSEKIRPNWSESVNPFNFWRLQLTREFRQFAVPGCAGYGIDVKIKGD